MATTQRMKSCTSGSSSGLISTANERHYQPVLAAHRCTAQPVGRLRSEKALHEDST